LKITQYQEMEQLKLNGKAVLEFLKQQQQVVSVEQQ
jgi:hypothetical protein